jgi:hypothetical protein
MATFAFTIGGDNFTGTPGENNTFRFQLAPPPSTLQATDIAVGNLAGDFIDILEVTDGGTVDPANLAGVSNIEFF